MKGMISEQQAVFHITLALLLLVHPDFVTRESWSTFKPQPIIQKLHMFGKGAVNNSIKCISPHKPQ